MRDYKGLTQQDYINAKTDEKAFEKVYLAHQKLIPLCFNMVQKLSRVMDYEYEDALRDGLVKAIMNFDPSMGYTFGNFAINCMINEVKTFNRNRGYSVDLSDRNNVLSLEGLFQFGDSSDDAPQWEDMIEDGEFEKEKYSYLEEKVNLKNYLELLSGTEREVFEYLLEGKNAVSIARIKGLTRQRGSQLTLHAKTKIKAIIERAKAVHKYYAQGVSEERIAEILQFTKPEIAGFYEEIYKILFLDGKKPELNRIWLNNPYKVCRTRLRNQLIGNRTPNDSERE